MDIYNYLKKDHRKISDLFAKIISSKGAHERKSLFEELKNELLVHIKTEHETFYKALKHSLPGKIDHADEEHSEIKKALAKVDDLSSESTEWLVQLGELKNIVEHHVKEEEGEIFHSAKKILSEKKAKELAEEMETLKADILETV